MHKVHEEVKQFYLENPEQFEIRCQALWEATCDYMKLCNVSKSVRKEVLDKFVKIKEIAWSYWRFPDLEDMKKIVDIAYQKYDKNIL